MGLNSDKAIAFTVSMSKSYAFGGFTLCFKLIITVISIWILIYKTQI